MTGRTVKERRDRFLGKKIGVLMGGMSGEREISLRSGKRVLDSLVSMGYRAVGIDVDRGIPSRLEEEKIDVAFLMLHGRFGEDGAIQGLLEHLGIPYTGSGILASALSMNKVMTKRLLAMEGIPTPDHVELRRDTDLPRAVRRIADRLSFPAVIKPVSEGSSLGVLIVDDRESLEEGLKADFESFSHLMVEEFIDGTSVTVGILGIDEETRPLPTLELRPKARFYDYHAKYTPGMTEFVCPAELEEELYRRTQEMALKAHRSLGCRGFSRVDMQVNPERGPYVLEINTIPGMTELSDFPAEAAVEGLSYDEVVEEILMSAPLEPAEPV